MYFNLQWESSSFSKAIMFISFQTVQTMHKEILTYSVIALLCSFMESDDLYISKTLKLVNYRYVNEDEMVHGQ